MSLTEGAGEGHFAPELEPDRLSLLGLPHPSTTGWWLKQQNFTASVLEAGSSRSRCWQELVPTESREEASVPGLSPWIVKGHLLPRQVCFCVQISPFYKDTSHNR